MRRKRGIQGESEDLKDIIGNPPGEDTLMI